MGETVTCPLCFRVVLLDDSGKMCGHEHTPMFGERCSGGGRTVQEARDHATAELRKWRQRNAAKRG